MSRATIDDLLNIEVERIMSTPVVSIDKAAKVSDAVQVMFQKDIESLVVVDHARVVGIMTFRDLVRRILLEEKKPSGLLVEDVMSKQLTTCRPTNKIIDVVKLMKKRRLRRMPVVDTEGRAVGFLSTFDLALIGLPIE
jgi:CBS domain-containing protein